jgi:hypothetical protein
MTTTARTDTWLNTVTVDGNPIGTWDALKGGDNDSTVTNYRPGGMAATKVVGGQTTVSPVTLDKSLEMETDWAIMSNLLRASVGVSQVVVSRQLLDQNKNPYGAPLIYTGILKQVLPGDTDSMKADPQIWSIVMVPAGNIG